MPEVKRTSISLQDDLTKKSLAIITKLLVKHKTKVGMATLLAGLLEMYDEKKHGAELRKALADLKKRDIRTTRHKDTKKSPADKIMSPGPSTKQKPKPKPQKKKPDTKAQLAGQTKRLVGG